MADTFHTRDWIRRNLEATPRRAVRFTPPELVDRSERVAEPPMTGVFASIAYELCARYPDDYAYALAVRNYRLNEDRGLVTKRQQRRMRAIETRRSLWSEMDTMSG